MKFLFVICISVGLLFVSSGLAAKAQVQEYQISYLTVEDGLSHNEVTSIAQDDEGFMWFGTRRGLNRFDGKEFINYGPKADMGAKVSDVCIEKIFYDSKGRIWIGTKYSGCLYYDTLRDRFVDPPGADRLRNSRIISFDEDTKGNVYVGSLGAGLIRFNADNESMDDLFRKGQFRGVICIDDTLLLWGNDKGLSFMGTEKEVDTRELSEESLAPTQIIVDKQKPYLWIVGWRLGLVCYNYYDQTMTEIAIPAFTSRLNGGLSLLQDTAGDIWVGTKGKGLFKYNVKQAVFQKIEIRPTLGGVIKKGYDVILDIFQDRAGDIWLATEGGGVVRLAKKKGFYTYGEDSGIGECHITAIFEDADGLLWVGTREHGLFLRNKEGKFTKIINTDTVFVNRNEAHYVRNIYQSGDGRIWVCFESSLFVIDNNDNGGIELVRAAKYLNSPDLFFRKPLDLVEADDSLWVATDMEGVKLFRKNKAGVYETKYGFNRVLGEKKSRVYWVSHLDLDKQNRLWVGANKGLFLYDKEQGALQPISNLVKGNNQCVKETILALHSDINGNLWFATPSGLNTLTEQIDGSYHLHGFTKKDGLVNVFINSILSDNEGNIWVSTNSGISKLDIEQREFSNYHKSDGIPHVDFSESVGWVGKDGCLYFGGQGGLVYFHAPTIRNDIYQPPLVITKFKILNENVRIEKNGVLTESINVQQRIELNHKQNEFSIEFAALDYKSPYMNQYAYWLEGRDTNRVSLGNRPFVSFSNLAPGEYKLHLYGTNRNGKWSGNERVLEINILPAPWKTMYALAAYIFVIIGIVMYIVSVSRKQERLAQSVEMEKALRENQRRLDEDKLRFFTNVSHEIRTPLTLILSPVSELLGKDLYKLGYDTIQQKISTVYQNGSKLLELVSQLLEFRKISAEKNRLYASENNLSEFLKQICKPFEDYAISKNIKFKLDVGAAEIPLFFDVEKMGVVINNLISNAIKYAGQPGRVNLKVTEEEHCLLISISNNGKGISSADIQFLFDLFYQSPDQSLPYSTGIGLSLVKTYVELHRGVISVSSTPGELTTFTVKLLKGKNHFNPEEISQLPTKTQIFEGSFRDEQTSSMPKINRAIQGAKVLIVEDREDVRNYITELLSENFNVILAEDGREGYKKALEDKPNLVISDVKMPRMDGFELCKKIKSNSLVAHIPVLLLTAKDRNDDVIFGTRQGADAYLTKPFDAALLLEKINMLITSREALFSTFSKKVVLAPKDEELEHEDARFINSLMAILEKNMDNVDFAQDQMADKMAMSYMTLNRRCKKLLDQTPGAFIRNIRLKKAAQLLRDSDLTISEIMHAVAYRDAKNFRTSFSKEYDMIPSEYREKNRKI